jgi:hypothetical protein
MDMILRETAIGRWRRVEEDRSSDVERGCRGVQMSESVEIQPWLFLVEPYPGKV